MTADRPVAATDDREALAEYLLTECIDGDFLVGAGRGIDAVGDDIALSEARAAEVVWWAVDAITAAGFRRTADRPVAALTTDIITAVLAKHILLGYGQCSCGVAFDGWRQYSSKHRTHVAAVIARLVERGNETTEVEA